MKRIIVALSVILSVVLGASGVQAAEKYLFNVRTIAPTHMPVGSIILWPTNNDLKTANGSEEWMICDGRELPNRLPEYGPIFSLIGYSFGKADSEGLTFNIPDLRGMFVRGTNTAGMRGKKTTPFNDPDAASRTAMQPNGNTGDQVGSVQPDEFKKHTHKVQTQSATGGSRWTIYTNQGSDTSVGSTGGAETRPVNAYLNYLIRVK
jgi:microcystin-dependent protein